MFKSSSNVLTIELYHQRRQADGTIVGRYGYVDPNGHQRVVEYKALGPNQFIATGDTGPDLETLRYAKQVAADDARAKATYMDEWTRAANRQANVPSNWPSSPLTSTYNSNSWAARTPSRSPVAAAPALGWPATPSNVNSNSARTTVWNDGRSTSWDMGSAYRSFMNAARKPVAQPQRQWSSAPAAPQVTRRYGVPRASNMPEASFDWPASPSAAQSGATSGVSQPFSYGFEIDHGTVSGQTARSYQYAN